MQGEEDRTTLNISSIMDTWITLKNLHGEKELKRQLYINKSRGMPHSADVRELTIGGERCGSLSAGRCLMNQSW